ncbi:MAG TPA: FAD-dependent oxidoreductase [Tepidisphaeraceae bacterium]|jgi:2-polyprenyl-6-methoxyphenol hydroxylase-like FAD-dependent oxidoreductase|nr:FAD-dependent oxidoreductase [Tepidisphaeraceae bacterium]
MSPARRDDYDVAVIGAGPSGVCAAAAASASADVLLIDATHRFGGSVTAAMHRCMCGLYSHAPQTALDTLNDSAQRNIVEKMLGKEPTEVRPRQFGKAWVLEFPASTWETALSDLCSEAKIDVQLDCRVTNVRREGSQLTAIQVEHPANRWITVGAVIDCTGGGHVLRLAGDDTFLPPEDVSARMLGGFAVRLAGLAGDPEMLRLQTPYFLARAVDIGLLPPTARFTAFYPGPGRGEGVCKLAVNPQELTPEEAELFAERVVQHLKQEIPGFAVARIVEKSPRILPRDGLRLHGRYVITEQDILQARQYGSEAVHGWWPIEKWDMSQGPTYAYPPVGQHYDIPPDALRCAAVENLFAAGCCLSATSTAAASTRASGICLATGDAAGRLAVSFVNQ